MLHNEQLMKSLNLMIAQAAHVMSASMFGCSAVLRRSTNLTPPSNHTCTHNRNCHLLSNLPYAVLNFCTLQGAQVSNPWNPGQVAGSSGVPTSPPAAPGMATTTEAGAAAVATVTGLEHLPAVQELGDGNNNELLNMLGMGGEEGGQLGGGSAGGGEGMYLSR
jgi:hypothetical protein